MGHRKKYYNSDGSLNKLGQAKQDYKTAKKEFDKAYGKAYFRSSNPLPYAVTRAGRMKTNAAWKNVGDKAEAANTAKGTYKQAKKEYRVGKKTVKEQQRQYGTLEDARSYKKNVKQKDVYKAYGSIEDAMRYSKYGNKKAESYAQKALDEMDRQLQQGGKMKNYDMTKVNRYIDQALDAIDKELAKYN